LKGLKGTTMTRNHYGFNFGKHIMVIISFSLLVQKAKEIVERKQESSTKRANGTKSESASLIR
jgi:hypothetical protein